MARGQELARHEELRAIRRIEEPAWRDIARLIRSDGDNFDDVRTEKQRDDAEVYDSTGLYALDEFTAGFFGQAVNPASRWFELGLDDPDLAKWGPVKDFLWKAAARIYSSLSPSVSTFYEEAPAWMADMGAFGDGFMGQEEWVGRDFFIDQAYPLAECFKDVDAAGRLETFSREFVLTGRQIVRRYADRAPAKVDEKKRHIIIHQIYPNDDRRPGRLGPDGMPWRSCTVSPDIKDWRIEGGFHEMPSHEIMWNRSSGRAWARGPGHNARADLSMLNEMERSDLVAAQFDAERVVLLPDESAITRADIVPNAVIEGGMHADKPALQYLESKSNFGRTQTKAEQRRKAIHMAFRFGIQQVMDRPEMTLGEFMGWQEEQLKASAPNLARVQNGLAGHVGRRFRLLARAGQLPAVPRELEGRLLAVNFISPLAKAQKLATGRQVMQFAASIGELAKIKRDVVDKANWDGMVDVLHDATSGNPDIVFDDRTVAMIRQRRAELQAQQTKVEQSALAAETVAKLSHAAQAGSLARGRSQ